MARDLGLICRGGSAAVGSGRRCGTLPEHGAPPSRAACSTTGTTRRPTREADHLAGRRQPRSTRSCPASTTAGSPPRCIVVRNADRANASRADRLLRRMNFEMFYNPNARPDGADLGLLQGRLLGRRAQPGRSHPGGQLPRRSRRQLHRLPLRHHRLGDPDRLLHRHRPRSDPAKRTTSAPSGPFLTDLRLAGAAAGRRDPHLRRGRRSSRVPTPTAACASCRAGAARCSRR